MREAKPDDPIFKAGFIIGEKRLRNSPLDLTKLGKAKDKDTGTRPKQIEQEEGLIKEP